jgi:CubicO group peptidase (beta-lactamase class C family)
MRKALLVPAVGVSLLPPRFTFRSDNRLLIIGRRVVFDLKWLLIVIAAALPFAARATDTPCAVPAIIDDGWGVESLSRSGFDMERFCMIVANLASREQNLHSLIVERHGRIVAELYRSGKDQSPYRPFSLHREFGPTVLHDTRSVGKSVVSLLLGIASRQGKIGALTTPALDFYPEYADLVTPQRKAVTLEHLLTMSSGLEWDEGAGFPDDEIRLLWKWAPYRYVLSRPMVALPGTKFNYNSGGTAVLADILSRATGSTFKDYARVNLFEPLGIVDWEWVSDLHGRTRVYDGLRMRPRDMAKIGRMVADQGKWQGQQIVPAEWIAASLRPRIDTGFGSVQYGYQWWTDTVNWHGRKLSWSAAFGRGSQRVFVVPDLDMTVVITAGTYDEDLRTAAHRVDALFLEIVSTVRE